MAKIFYIGNLVAGFNDGGQSRNKAFRQAFLDRKASIKAVYDSNPLIRLFYGLNVLMLLLISKGNQIFVHQGSLMVLFPIPIIKFGWIRKLVFKLLQHSANRNAITIEVNDLPYEQSKDLELPVRKGDKVFQEGLYSLKNTQYVFASHEMGKYVKEKYGLDYKVVLNGSDKLKDFSASLDLPSCFQSLETKYIYAGGLNKGRQIELLISKFRDRKEILILIGEWGDWLLDYELPANIFYLGKFQEDQAHYITSKCDIGIIPYDEMRFYYNVCYPTKASFYITAGIPFLSTPLEELKNVFENTGMVYFVPIEQWDAFMDYFDRSSLANTKKLIKAKKHEFYWDTLLGNYLDD
jgi:hypothetical protein